MKCWTFFSLPSSSLPTPRVSEFQIFSWLDSMMRWLHEHKKVSCTVSSTDTIKLCLSTESWAMSRHTAQNTSCDFSIQPTDILCWLCSCLTIHSEFPTTFSTCLSRRRRQWRKIHLNSSSHKMTNNLKFEFSLFGFEHKEEEQRKKL